MATLLSDFVWEGLSTEPKPLTARDGHIFKELYRGSPRETTIQMSSKGELHGNTSTKK